jgi:hypothetical protein
MKLIIMPDGKAKTINPFGSREFIENWLNNFIGDMRKQIASQWNNAEAQRKSYEVSVCRVLGCSDTCLNESFRCKIPGTIVEAELIDENTVRVVKIVNE